MNTATASKPYELGTRMGLADAKAYAKGSKTTRATIRRRLAKAELATYGNPFYAGYTLMLTQCADSLGKLIRGGALPRTIKPTKLFALTRGYTV